MSIRSAVLIAAVVSVTSLSSLAHADGKRINDDKWFGCVSKDYHGKLISMAVQGDKEAFSKDLMGGILSGQCVTFKAGEPVYLEDTAIFSGLVKVRRAGGVESYWTNLEAIR